MKQRSLRVTDPQRAGHGAADCDPPRAKGESGVSFEFFNRIIGIAARALLVLSGSRNGSIMGSLNRRNQ